MVEKTNLVRLHNYYGNSNRIELCVWERGCNVQNNSSLTRTQITFWTLPTLDCEELAAVFYFRLPGLCDNGRIQEFIEAVQDTKFFPVTFSMVQ